MTIQKYLQNARLRLLIIQAASRTRFNISGVKANDRGNGKTEVSWTLSCTMSKSELNELKEQAKQ